MEKINWNNSKGNKKTKYDLPWDMVAWNSEKTMVKYGNNFFIVAFILQVYK